MRKIEAIEELGGGVPGRKGLSAKRTALKQAIIHSALKAKKLPGLSSNN